MSQEEIGQLGHRIESDDSFEVIEEDYEPTQSKQFIMNENFTDKGLSD